MHLSDSATATEMRGTEAYKQRMDTKEDAVGARSSGLTDKFMSVAMNALHRKKRRRDTRIILRHLPTARRIAKSRFHLQSGTSVDDVPEPQNDAEDDVLDAEDKEERVWFEGAICSAFTHFNMKISCFSTATRLRSLLVHVC